FGVSREAQLAVVPGVESLTFDPPAVPGGQPAVGTVQLRRLAPPGGMVVDLASSDPKLAAVPAQVTVPAGMLTAAFPVTTVRPAASVSVVIRATVAGVTQTGELDVSTD